MKIKNVFLAILSALMVTSCAGSSNKTNQDSTATNDGPKAVVCYFSATGTTKAQAQRLADMIGADLHEITAYEPYTEADLDGKTIVPFMTSGGSDITNSEKDLSETYPDLKFAKGLLMNDVSDEDIIEWIKPLGIQSEVSK